jgi:GWxTD domain-containing protein
MRRTALLAASMMIFSLAGIAVRAATGSILGLAPSSLPLHNPLQDLSEAERRAARDALYERADRGDGAAQAALDLAILLATEGSVEGRVDARAYFERARAAAPDRLDVLLWESQTRAWGRDLAGAIEVLEEGRDRFGTLAEWHYARGVCQWQRGLRHLDPSALDAAYGDFAAALSARPQSKPYRLGVAATCLALQRWPELLTVTDVPDDHPAVGPRLVLYRGCALAALGRDEEAEPLLAAVVRVLSPKLRAVFEDGMGFLVPATSDTARWVHGYWRALDPHPTRISNARELEYWRRLIEADVLFGDGDQAGWETQPGSVWVRFGRPAAMEFQSADVVPWGNGADPRDRYEGRGIEDEPQGLLTFMPAMAPKSTEYDPRVHRWHWSYAYGDQSFVVTFLDTTYHFDWMTSGTSERDVAPRIRETPLYFVEQQPPVSLGLSVALTGFCDEAEESSLETSIGVGLPSDQPAEVDVEWAVFDEHGRRIDRVVRRLDASRKLSALVRCVQTAPPDRVGDPLVTQIAARLTPGRFRVAVEATHPASGAHASREFLVDLTGLPQRVLAVSDLMLSASFQRVSSATRLPSEFIRHAQAVIPLADRAFVMGDPHAYVYYEIYGLQRGADGRGDVEISYRIHPVAGGRPLGSKPAREASFLENGIEMGAGGNLVKGTQLDLAGLGAGEYALTVVVRDVRAGTDATRHVRFRLVSPPTR